MIVRSIALLLTYNAITHTILSNDSDFEYALSLSKAHIRDSIDISIKFSLEAEQIAIQNNNVEQLAQAYWMLGYQHELKGQVAKASRYYHRGSEIYIGLDKPDLALNLHRQNARTKLNHGLFSLALKEYSRSEYLLEHISDYKLQSEFLFDKGLSQTMIGYHDDAIRSFMKAMRLVYAYGDQHDLRILTKIHNELGLIFEDMAVEQHAHHFHDSAILHFKKCLDLSSDPLDQAKAWNNLGLVQLHSAKVDTAAFLFEEAVYHAQKTRSKQVLIPMVNNQAVVAYLQGNIRKADYLFGWAIDLNIREYTVDQIMVETHLPIMLNNTAELIRSYQYLDSLGVGASNNQALIYRLQQMIKQENAAKKEEVELVYREEMALMEREAKDKERKALLLFWGSLIGATLLLMITSFLAHYYYKKHREKQQSVNMAIARLKHRQYE
ncbi:MAG: hypothetical protein ABJG41_01335 [Cyclobacteriaceae bacterium]